MKKFILVTVLSLGFLVSGCGPQAFVEGEYDSDVNSTNLLNDRWSESDMQNVVRDLVAGMVNHPVISSNRTRPTVIVTRLQNKTMEQIDTQSVMDMVRVELSRGGRVRFVDKEAREDVADEINYQQSGTTSAATRKRMGQQIGADFIVNGRLDSIVQQVGRRKTVYYKVTLNLTNLQTNIIEWSDYKQIRKKFKKRRVGL